MRIIFVRHGHPNYEKDCLTDLGRLHAEAAANRLAEEGIVEIYSSPLGRASETASYTAKKLDLPVHICDFMKEINWGSNDNEPLAFQGHPWDTVDDMIAHNESILASDWMLSNRFNRNIILKDIQHVATETDVWLATLGYVREGSYYRACGDTDRTIAAFGHGGASAAILSHIFNLPYPFTCSIMGPTYTGITIVSFPNQTDKLISPHFEIMNDARHIQGLTVENVYFF